MSAVFHAIYYATLHKEEIGEEQYEAAPRTLILSIHYAVKENRLFICKIRCSCCYCIYGNCHFISFICVICRMDFLFVKTVFAENLERSYSSYVRNLSVAERLW